MRTGAKIGLTLGILIPTILIGTPVAFYFGFLFDNSDYPVVQDPTFDSNTITNRIVNSSLDTTRIDRKLKIGVSEYDLNQLLFTVKVDENNTFRPWVEVNSMTKGVDLFVDANIPFLPTVLKISTNINYVSNPVNFLNNGVLLKINEIKIGRLGVNDWLLGLGKDFINNQTIENALKGAGFNTVVDLANRQIFYPAVNIINDVIEKANIENIYKAMAKFMIAQNLLSIECTKEKLGIDLDISRLTNNKTYVDDSKSVKLSEKMFNNIGGVKKLLDSNYITSEEAKYVFEYMQFGYNNSTDTVKGVINKIPSLSSLGITDAKSYAGFNIPKGDDISQVFETKVKNFDLSQLIKEKKMTISFSEDDLNATLKTSNIIGKTMYFDTLERGFHKLNAIFIDDFYVSIFDNYFNFVIGVNINGCSTKLIVKAKPVSTDGKTVKLSIDDILFGELVANDDIKHECKAFVMDALSNLNSWFRADGNNNLIFFDLNQCVSGLSDVGIKEFLSDTTLSFKTNGETLKDNGNIEISFNKNI